MARITISLSENEKAALIFLAEREMRDPRAQAALIIRKALEFEALLLPEDSDLLYQTKNTISKEE